MISFTEIISDPLITIAIIIASVSTFLVVILGYYYKKIKEQQIIYEVTKKHPIQKEKQQKLQEETSKTIISHQEYELIISQLNELSSQINNLTGHIKELSAVFSFLKDNEISSSEEFSLTPDVISKLVSVLEKIQTDMNNLKTKTENSISSIEEIKVKLDNLLKLLSTILQQ
ncbi:MAG: hypothetical protein ABDH23_03365 [Endomicrobiia bacterium]